MKLDIEVDGTLDRREESVLLVDENSSDLKRATESLASEIPDAHVVAVNSLFELRNAIESHTFDVVVLDNELSGVGTFELLHELKLRDYEPSVLVVSTDADGKAIVDAFNSGCERYLVKDDNWLSDLGPAVRHVLRLKRLEEENRSLMAKLTEANQLLEEKNQRLDEFCATVAHDIRGPLAGIVMKLEFMQDFYDDVGDDRYKQVLQSAKFSSERLTSVLQSMYNLAKLGERATFMSEVNLESLMDEVVSDLPYDDSLDIEITLGDLPVVWGNQDLLSRVFMNLITNAIKYNDKPTKKIAIGVERVEKSSFGPFCHLFVRDNGNGISEREQATVFSMFQRGSVKSDTEGTGIGLSVVRRIIELHYGKIFLHSEEGVGTTFSLSLPMERLAVFSASKKPNP